MANESVEGNAGDTPTWSVEIVIGHQERAAIEYAGMQAVGPHHFMVVRPAEGGVSPSTVHIDVPAGGAEDAMTQALATYATMRQLAQLQADPLPTVLTVARIAGVPHTWDRYIFEAEDMMDQRRFELAVVAAQIHVEMYTRHALDQVAKRAGTKLAEVALTLPRTWSLTDQVGATLFGALTGVMPSEAGCWEAYRTHVYRRNAVVHQGSGVTEALAEASVNAAVDMVRFIQTAASRKLSEDGSGSPMNDEETG
jgi:hypothetical protein